MIVERQSRETRVSAAIEVSPGTSTISTGAGFLDHMLLTLARYAGWTLSVRARGDLPHHVIEDVAITMGIALRRTVPDSIARFGHRVVAMDDALVAATIDVGGRVFYEGPIPSDLYDHFFRSFCEHAGVTLHVEVRRGRNRHHVVEAAFKAVGMALHDALQPVSEPVSTKGVVRLSPVEEGNA